MSLGLSLSCPSAKRCTPRAVCPWRPSHGLGLLPSLLPLPGVACAGGVCYQVRVWTLGAPMSSRSLPQRLLSAPGAPMSQLKGVWRCERGAEHVVDPWECTPLRDVHQHLDDWCRAGSGLVFSSKPPQIPLMLSSSFVFFTTQIGDQPILHSNGCTHTLCTPPGEGSRGKFLPQFERPLIFCTQAPSWHYT